MEEDDVHVCLVCNQTILGLMNYVNHKKMECPGRKQSFSQPVVIENKSVASTDGLAGTFQVTDISVTNVTSLTSADYNIGSLNPLFDTAQNSFELQTSQAFIGSQPSQAAGSQYRSPDTLPYIPSQATPNTSVSSCMAVNISDSLSSFAVDKNLVSPSIVSHSDLMTSPSDKPSGLTASEKIDDFFSSLELRSKSATTETSTRPEALPQTRTDLPISNILNNLTFSSDEDDLGFPFNEDVNLEDFSEDSETWNPPVSHTGGKWKPGEGPGTRSSRGRPPGGKWRPGTLTNQTSSRKKKPFRSRGHSSRGGRGKPGSRAKKQLSNSGDKMYTCNICKITFVNRFVYSNHCSSKKHRDNVFGTTSSVGSTEETTIAETRAEPEAAVDQEEHNQHTEGDEASIHSDSTEDYDTVTPAPSEHTEEATADRPSDSQRDILHICTICDKKYSNKYLMSRHLITRFHKNRSKDHPDALHLLQTYHKYIVRLSPFQCEICQFYFNTRETFERHIKTAEHLKNCSELLGELTCSLCSFKTHEHASMLDHFGTNGHKDRLAKKNRLCVLKESHVKMACKFCGITMQSFARLRRHTLSKHSNKEKTPPSKRVKGGYRPRCPTCGKQCQCASALKLHTRRHHTKEKPYKCNLCVKSFCDKHTLELHLKSSRHIKKLVNSEEQTNDPTRGMSLNKTEDALDCDNDALNQGEQDGASKDAGNQSELDSAGYNVRIRDATRSNKDDLSHKYTTSTKRNYLSRKRTKDKTFKCNHCDFTVINYNDLRPHYLKVHSSKVRMCEICDLVFLTVRSLKLHMLSKSHQENMSQTGNEANDVKYFECNVCKKKFTDENYCKFHTEFVHNHLNTEDAVIKKFGGKDLTRRKYADVLADIESKDKTARIQCPDCPNTLKKINFIEHLRLHCGDRPFECKLCRKGFISAVTLRRHLLGHFGCQERTCEICGKEYKKLASYEHHMSVHELEKAGEKKLHVCEVCGQSFFFPYQLLQHSRRHREREFKCTVPGCHWKFVYKNELKQHMRSHSQEKPYLCDICGYAATTNTRLQRHNRTHTGERKYHCEYCTYKAGNSTHLHRHMRIHIGSKPYKCPYCEYTCNTHENIRKHISQTKKHEGLKIYPCKFCDYGTNSCKNFRNHILEKHEDRVGNQNLDALSAFTGLYKRDLDPKQPVEGTRIIPVKEKAAGHSSAKKAKKQKVQEDPAEVEKAVMYFNQDHGNMSMRQMNSDGDGLDTNAAYSDEPPLNMSTQSEMDEKTYTALQPRTEFMTTGVIEQYPLETGKSYVLMPNVNPVPVTVMMSGFTAGNGPASTNMYSSQQPPDQQQPGHNPRGVAEPIRPLHAHQPSDQTQALSRSLLQGGRFRNHGFNKYGNFGNAEREGREVDGSGLVIDMAYPASSVI